MSDREIYAILTKVKKIEICADYEREDEDVMYLIDDTYTEYRNTLGY